MSGNEKETRKINCLPPLHQKCSLLETADSQKIQKINKFQLLEKYEVVLIEVSILLSAIKYYTALYLSSTAANYKQQTVRRSSRAGVSP